MGHLKFLRLSFCFCILQVHPSLYLGFFSLISGNWINKIIGIKPSLNQWWHVKKSKKIFKKKKKKNSYLLQHLVFSSSSQAAALESDILFRHSFPVSKCLKLLEISSSSSSLELQFDATESYWDGSCSFAKWHSCNWEMSMVALSPPSPARPSGPDLLAGVLWRAGEVLLNGVGHLEVVELPRGVISVPMSLCWTSITAPATFILLMGELLNRKPSFVGKIGSTLSINLSVGIKFGVRRNHQIYMQFQTPKDNVVFKQSTGKTLKKYINNLERKRVSE